MDILDYFAGILPAMLEDYNEKGLRETPPKPLKLVAGTGFEPATSGL